MKTVFMDMDFYYYPHRKITAYFKAGNCYINVPDAAAAAIINAGAGTVLEAVPETDCIDASRDASMRKRTEPGRSTWHQARPGAPSKLRQPNLASTPGSQVFRR